SLRHGDAHPPVRHFFPTRRSSDLAQTGIEALQDGAHTAEEVNALARQVIEDGGYGEWFRHRLGHGIGMDVHEPPYLDKGDTSVLDRKSTRLNSSHVSISYAVFCLK